MRRRGERNRRLCAERRYRNADEALVGGRRVAAGGQVSEPTSDSACRITSVTAWGWEIMIT